MKKTAYVFRACLYGFLASMSLLLVACQIIPLETNTPTGDNARQLGYPGPAPTSTLSPVSFPTQVDGSPNDYYSYFATPSPDERVGVVEVMEAPRGRSAPTYEFQNLMTEGKAGRIMELIVTNPITGHKIRLGDDTGSAIMGAISDRFVAWHFLCEECQSIKPGIYVRSFADDVDIWVDSSAITVQHATQISGIWLIYMKRPDSYSRYAAHLYAYNLESGKGMLVNNDVVYIPSNASAYIALGENMVAWIGDGPTVNDRTLNVYDLAAQKMQQINVKLKDARYLSVSRNLVVWWDVFWKGYNLESNELFTIPVLPDGWDPATIERVGPVFVEGNQLWWSLERNGSVHHFSAVVVKK